MYSKSHMELMFSPPNSASVAQPLNMGIALSFNSSYNNFLNDFLIYFTLETKGSYSAYTKKLACRGVLLV